MKMLFLLNTVTIESQQRYVVSLNDIIYKYVGTTRIDSERIIINMLKCDIFRIIFTAHLEHSRHYYSKFKIHTFCSF